MAEVPLTDEELAKLFDKDYRTYVTLPGNDYWRFVIKKPFNVAYIKVLDVENEYVQGVVCEVEYPTGYGIGLDTQPFEVKDEIKQIIIRNITSEPVDIAEIIIEKYHYAGVIGELTIGDIVITNSEAAPVNVQPLEELIEEDIVFATYYRFGEEPVELTRPQIEAFFGKTKGTNAWRLSIGEYIEFELKKPFRIKELKVLYPTLFINGEVGILAFDVDGATEHSSETGIIVLDTEIVSFMIYQLLEPKDTIGQIIGELFLDRRVFPQEGANFVSSTEAEPLNVEEHQTLVREDVVDWVSSGLPPILVESDIVKLFDKNYSTACNIPALDEQQLPGDLLLILKMPMRIKEIKLIQSLTPNYITDSGLYVIVWYPDDTSQEFIVGVDEFPFVIDREVCMIELINVNETVYPVGELIIEKFFDSRVFPQDNASFGVSSEEKTPLNVIADDELISEHIKFAVIDNGEVPLPLTREQIDSLFDKDITTKLTLPSGNTLTFYLKKPFDIDKIKVLSPDDEAEQALILSEDVTIRYVNIKGDSSVDISNPVIIDDEVSYFIITNTSQESSVDIVEIIGEIEHRVVNKPVIYGINYADYGEIAAEDNVEYDIFGLLGRNGHDGYVINDGDTVLTIEVSENPQATAYYGSPATLNPNEIYDLEKFNIGAIRITNTDVDDAGNYRINVI